MREMEPIMTLTVTSSSGFTKRSAALESTQIKQISVFLKESIWSSGTEVTAAGHLKLGVSKMPLEGSDLSKQSSKRSQKKCLCFTSFKEENEK